MSREAPKPEELVMTQAEPVPPPAAAPVPGQEPGDGDLDFHLLLQVKELADRVGGPEKLRELVDTLIRLQAPAAGNTTTSSA